MQTSTITPRDRLGFTLFLAISAHAALILGVGFSSALNLDSSPTIEVTLALSADPETPEEADFLAATNQTGSGDAAEVLETTTTTDAEFHENLPQEVMAAPTPRPEQPDASRALLTTVVSTDEQAPTEEQIAEEAVPLPEWQTDKSYEELAREIASLEARIAQDEQTNAKGPRVKRLTSVSTKSAAEAADLNHWRQKVERVGNANYPSTRVFGDLRLLVVIAYDGDLRDVRILESSGHRELDAAALRIVRLAAPYQDFPVDMRKRYDQLEIIRTWKFSRGGNQLDS